MDNSHEVKPIVALVKKVDRIRIPLLLEGLSRSSLLSLILSCFAISLVFLGFIAEPFGSIALVACFLFPLLYSPYFAIRKQDKITLEKPARLKKSNLERQSKYAKVAKTNSKKYS